MKLIHRFRSGNSCGIHIPEIEPNSFNETQVKWEQWPPSDSDVCEWSEEVYPNRVIPRLEEEMRKSRGPGRMVEIMPGIRAWISTSKERKEK
jgi:hypothetical protein